MQKHNTVTVKESHSLMFINAQEIIVITLVSD